MSSAAIALKVKVGIVTTIIMACLALPCIVPGSAYASNTKSTAYALKSESPYKVTLKSDYDSPYWFKFTAPSTDFYDFVGTSTKKDDLYITVFDQDAKSDDDYIAFEGLDSFTEKATATALCKKGKQYFIEVSSYEDKGKSFTLAAAKHNHDLETSFGSTSCKTCNAWFSAEIAGDPYSFTYTGKALTPKVNVCDISDKKIPSSYYSIAYSNNTKPGTAKITIAGKGPYKGVKRVESFYIDQAPQKIKLVTSKTILKKDLKKKARGYNVFKSAKGDRYAYITKYIDKRAEKYISLSSEKIIVKKSTPKGTYRLKVYAFAFGNKYYDSGSVTKTIKVVVK